MIESVETLESILEPYAGQTVWCEEDRTVYRWDPVAGWESVPDEDETTSEVAMNMYDINKQIIGQLQILDEETLQEKKNLIRDFCNATKNEYYMLLCRDINYYTLFRLDLKLADETIDDVVIECAQCIGDIKAIDAVEEGAAIEFWMTEGSETYAAYFFPYDEGVVVCG